MNPFDDSDIFTAEDFLALCSGEQNDAEVARVAEEIFHQNHDYAMDLGVAECEQSVTVSPNTTMSPNSPFIPEIEDFAEPAIHTNQDQIAGLFPGLDPNLDAFLSTAAFAPTPMPQPQRQRQNVVIRPQRNLFPVNPFLNLDKQDRKNVEAARLILSMLKVLAINEDPRGKRFTLMSERNAILSMSTNYTLNLQTDAQLSFPQLLQRAFHLFDCDSTRQTFAGKRTSNGQFKIKETAERGFLLVAIRLLRHKFMYEPWKDSTKQFAKDFESLLPKSSMCRNKRLFVKRTKDLCRIIVACGHPCIVLILVRISIRRNIQLSDLLDQLPIQQFCHFLSTGQVSSTNLHVGPRIFNNQPFQANSGHQLETDLLYAREYILMPLLSIASQRIPQTFFMFDGKIEFNVEACLTAIVPFVFQSQYAAFLRDEIEDEEWETGQVAVEISTPSLIGKKDTLSEQQDPEEISDPSDNEDSGREDLSTETQYSIRKDKRTFYHFNHAKYSVIEECFDKPPGFLKNGILNFAATDE